MLMGKSEMWYEGLQTAKLVQIQIDGVLYSADT